MALSAALLIAAAVTLFVYMLVEVAASNLRTGAAADRRRRRRRWLLGVLPILFAALTFLFHTPSLFAKYWPVGLYLLLWIIPIWFLVHAYRLAIERDLRLVRDLYDKPIPHPEKLVFPLALADLFVAVATVVALVVIPVLQLRIGVLAPVFTAIAAVHWVVLARYRKSDVA